MKKLLVLLLATAFLFFQSCEKEKTVITEADGDKTTIEHIGFDDEKLDSAQLKVKVEADKAASTAKEALNDAGQAIEKGAKEVKEGAKEITADAAEAVEKGARDVKESAEN